MASYADKWTDEKLKSLESKLNGIYTEAWKDLSDKTAEYWAEFQNRYVKEHNAYLDGKYTKEQFDAWCRAQVGRGSRWEGMRDQMAARLANTNAIAASYINNVTPTVFAENANYTAFQIEQGTDMAVSFDMVDETTVKRLSTGPRELFPKMSNSLSEDELWNKQKLQNSLLQGILQGESIGKIADRFESVTGMNRNSAVRNARTAVTGAQNAGRQETYEKASKMGIDVQKEWIATEDARTRESHAMLNGVRVAYDEDFPNGLRYPGDPYGEPSELYNCRCTLRAILPKYNGAKRTANDVRTYNEWKVERTREKEFSNNNTYESNYENRSSVGLAANGNGSTIVNHKSPELINHIDFNDENKTLKVLSDFEKDNIKSDIEVACVICKNGNVYKCYGIENRVFPDYDLGDELVGAKVTHIHPEKVTGFTFSDADLELFSEYELAILRGSDVKYTYELNRGGNVEDKSVSIPDYPSEDFYMNEMIKIKASKYGYGYWRHENK